MKDAIRIPLNIFLGISIEVLYALLIMFAAFVISVILAIKL